MEGREGRSGFCLFCLAHLLESEGGLVDWWKGERGERGGVDSVYFVWFGGVKEGRERVE